MIDARIAMLAAFAALSAASPTLADPYCQPVNDRNQIAETGRVCPSGYVSTGRCCEALHYNTPRAFARVPGRSCPTGAFASNSDYCVTLKR